MRWLLAMLCLGGCGTLLGLDDLIYDVELGNDGGGGDGGSGAEGLTGGAGGAGGAIGGGGGEGGTPLIEGLNLGEHRKGQASDKLGGYIDVTEVFYAFRAVPTFPIDVTALSLTINSIAGIVLGDIVEAKLYIDDGDVLGAVDANDTSIGDGVVAASAISFAGAFPISAETNLIVSLQILGATVNEHLELELTAANVSAEAMAGGPVAVAGDVTAARHEWHASDLGPGDARLVYRHEGAGLRMRRYDSIAGTWQLPQMTVATSGAIKFVITPEYAARDDQVFAVLDDTGSGTMLSVVRFLPPMSWAVEWTAQDVLVADSNKRAFDVAYESGSRVPMVVYAYNDNQPMYRLGHGDSWTTEAPVFATPPGQGGVDWIELVSHPRRNEIALFYSDDDGGLYAVIWDGEQWNESVAQQLESALNRRDFQNFAASYETLSGDLLVTWAHPVNTYDGFWSATKPNASSVFSSPLFDDTLTKPGPISLAPDAGDRISVAHLEHSCGGGSCDNFEAAIWNGSVWTAKTVVDGQLEQPYGSRPGTQPVGTAWVDENAYAVYAGNGVTGLDWGRWTMAGWTQQPDVPVSPAMAETVNVQALGLGSHALFVISDLSGDLWAKRRNDNSWIDTEGGARLGDIGIVEARPFHMTGRR